MASKFQEESLKIVVQQLCQNIGFQGILSSSLDVLSDLLHRYLTDITTSTHRYTEHYGRTAPTLEDLGLALKEMGVSVRELEEYVTYVEPSNFPHKVPKLPVPRPSNLNFLKPGAREILSRPLHIHEHLPPMYPEKEEEQHMSNLNDDDDDKDDLTNSQASPQEKRPIEEDPSPNKKVKWTEEEGEPVREIDSVMMTTSGYISSAREGKMPEARKPLIAMSVSGGGCCVSKSPSSIIKKKATMEKIIRHKNHQGGIMPGPMAKPKVKHVKLKPKIPLAPPGTGSLKHMRSSGTGQAPKLKIPNMNKEKDANPVKKSSSEKEEKKRKEKKEGRERKKRDREERGSKKNKKDEHHGYKYHIYNRKERSRIRMRGLSKEEELRRYKERENELIAALAASSAVTVTSIPPPSLKVREKPIDTATPTPTPSESSSKSKLSVFRKFPKLGSKEGGSDSSPDLMIDAPVVKEEKLSPPPSPRMDIPDMQEEISTNLPPTPRTPETHHFPIISENQMISPHKIKKEKDPEKPSKKKSPRSNKKGSSSFNQSWRDGPEFGSVNRPRTPEGNLIGIPGEISEGPPLFGLPPFPHGPSLIPPFPRFPFIPPFGAPIRPTVHDINPIPRMFVDNPVFPVDKEQDNFENIDPPLPSPPPVTTYESRTRNVSPVIPHMNLESKIHIAEKSVLHSPPRVMLSEQPIPQPAKPEKPDKEKKKEHKKEKKEKEKEKQKKKEKKEREKREKEEKKKEKKEEKERLKKERKEKKKSSSSEGVPKITLKLPAETEGDAQNPPSEAKVMPKLVIKPVLKHPVNEQPPSKPIEKPRKKKNTAKPPPPPLPPPPPPPPSSPPIPIPTPSVPLSTPLQHSPPVSPSFSSPTKSPVKTHGESPGSPPEIAKFSALVTRPPKGKKSRPFPVIHFQGLHPTSNVDHNSSSKKSGELSVPPLKIKDSGYKISSKKDASGSIKIESKEKETTVPPLKIKNSSSSSVMNSPSVKFVEDKKSSHSKKSEKKEKEKRKTSPLIITSLSNIDTGGSTPVLSVCPPQPSPPQPPPVSTIQLPPIHVSSETPQTKGVKKSSGVGASPSVSSSGPQNKSGTKSSGLLTETVGPIGHFVDDQGNEVWICPTCGKQDDGSPMIGCDTCDDWYHWVCVGIHVPPSERENWYCPRCLSQHKQQRGNLVEKKKRGRKRKII